MADARDAAGTRQLGPGAADRLPLGLRLQRAGRAARLHRPGRSLATAARAVAAMSVILVFLVVVIGFAGWWLAHQRLMSKPWLEVGPDPIGGPGPTGMPTAEDRARHLPRGGRRALRPLRQRLLHAHGVRRLAADADAADRLAEHRHAGARERRARMRARRGPPARRRARCASASPPAPSRRWPSSAGQLVAWRDLAASGYLVTGNPANSFFYLLTGLHGLHILGGLVALARAAPAAWGARRARGSSGSGSSSASPTGTSCCSCGSACWSSSPAGRPTSSTSAAVS